MGREVLRRLDAAEELVEDEAVRLLGDGGRGGERGADRDLTGRCRGGHADDHDARALLHAGAHPRRQPRGARVEIDPGQVPRVAGDDLQPGRVLVLQRAPDGGAGALVAAQIRSQLPCE